MKKQNSKQFWIDIIRHLPHHIIVKIAKAIGSETLTQHSYQSRQKELDRKPLKSYPEKDIAEYTKIIRGAKLWHGTGRYQHSGDKTVDVLSQIITTGGLRPISDHYAVVLGGEHMVSISVTRARIIARCYADIHGKGAAEANRYGSALWWVAYYSGPFFARLLTRNATTIVRQYKKWHKAASDAKGEISWGKKVNKNAKQVWDVFGLGSDIPDNYPILLGIKGQPHLATIPGSIAGTEVRLTHSVAISDFTHLEVPENKVNETKLLLKKSGLDLPVYPIELGEYVSSKQSITELLSA